MTLFIFTWPSHTCLAPILKRPQNLDPKLKSRAPKILTIVVFFFFEKLAPKDLVPTYGSTYFSIKDLPRLCIHLPNVFTYLPNQLPNYLSYQPTYPLRLRTYLGSQPFA